MKTGEKLKQHTKARGIKLYWLAEKMNITPQALYYKVNGASPITIGDGLKIRHFCRMSDDEFRTVFGEEEWFNLV